MKNFSLRPYKEFIEAVCGIRSRVVLYCVFFLALILEPFATNDDARSTVAAMKAFVLVSLVLLLFLAIALAVLESSDERKQKSLEDSRNRPDGVNRDAGQIYQASKPDSRASKRALKRNLRALSK